MDAASNPYAPGAGTRPPLLAGRDDLVSTAAVALARAKLGRHAKSFVAVGLRGVGKTVVLNKVHELAEAEGYQTAAIEAHDDASLANLLVPRLRTILIKISRIAGATEAKVTTIAPTRSNLISKGMIYSPSYGSTDFTVPLFDQFMRREMPNWDKKRPAE